MTPGDSSNLTRPDPSSGEDEGFLAAADVAQARDFIAGLVANEATLDDAVARLVSASQGTDRCLTREQAERILADFMDPEYGPVTDEELVRSEISFNWQMLYNDLEVIASNSSIPDPTEIAEGRAPLEGALPDESITRNEIAQATALVAMHEQIVLEDIRVIHREMKALEERLATKVEDARILDISWRAIAEALEINQSTALRRWSRPSNQG